MIRMSLVKTVAVSAALAFVAATAATAPASAAHHKTMKMAKKPKLVPAALKPSYRGMPGYVGGGPAIAGAPVMMPVDVPLVAPGAGVLNAGILPSSGMFKGVPVLGDLGL